jgi:hypothetical protein
MELKKDLLKIERKSLIKIILGLSLFVLTIIWMIVRINFNSDRMLDWLLSISFIINGINFFVEGLGFSPDRLFGKAYVEIDNEHILFKPKVFEKEQNISWDSIKNIEYKVNKYLIHKNDGSTVTLNLSNLDYDFINKIKSTIDFIAKEKNIVS